MPDDKPKREDIIRSTLLNNNPHFSPDIFQDLVAGDQEKIAQEGVMPSRGIKTEYDPTLFNELKGTIGYKDNLKPIPLYHGSDFLRERRAQLQSVGNRIIKTVPRIGTKVLSEVAKIPGYVGGLMDWGIGGGFQDDEIGRLVDNAWINSISNAEDYVKNEILPVYTPKEVQEGGLWKNISSASFWAKEGADGVGFLLSMLVPGAALKSAKIGTIGAKGIGKLGKLVKPGFQVGAKTAGKIDDVASVAVNTLFESASEAGETFDKVKNQLIEQGWSEEDAKQKAGESAVEVLMGNMVLLLGPNALTQNQLFKAFGRTKGINRLVGETGELLTDVSKRTFRQKVPLFGKEMLKSITSEGIIEEGGQFAMSQYAEDKALGKADNYDNYLDAILGTYIKNIGNPDMQKSIFLGGLLGGGMGMVGAYNQLQAEDRALFGDAGYSPNRFTKLLGKKERKPTEGLVNLLKNNYLNRYQDFEQIYKKDAQGNYVLDEAGDRQVDPAKLDQFKASLVNNDVNTLIQEAALQKGDQLTFDYLKSIKDLQYMLPYLQQPEGIDVLTNHINHLADKDLGYIKDVLGDTSGRTTQEIKQDLLDKARRYNKIYNTIEDTHDISSNVKYKEEDKSTYMDFSQDLKNAKLKQAFEQDFFRTKLKELKSEKASIESEGWLDDFLTVEEKKKLEKLDKDITLLEESLKESIKISNELYNDKKVQESYDDYLSENKELETEEQEKTKEETPDPIEQVKETIAPEVDEELENIKAKQVEKEVTPEKLDETVAQLVAARVVKGITSGNPISFKDLVKELNLQPADLKEARELYNQLVQNSSPELIEEEPELTSQEESVLEAYETEASTELDPEFTTFDSNEAVERELGRSDVELTENDPNSDKEITADNKIEYLYDRVVKGFNKLAYLSRKFIDVFKDDRIVRKDVGDTLNDELFYPLLNPNKYQEGTPITLVVKDDPSIPMYDDEGQFTTWGAYKAVKELEPGTQKYNLSVPIAVLDEGGNTIAYLHEVKWLNEDNVADTSSGILAQQEMLESIRDFVINSKEPVSTKITSKSFGKLFRSKKGYIKVSEAMPDPNLVIVYGAKKNAPEVSRGKAFKENYLGDIKSGRTYTMVQVGVKDNKPMYMALPVKQDKLNSTIIDTLFEATRAWLYDDVNIQNKLVETTNNDIDIADFKDVKKLFEYFIYNYKNDGFSDLIKSGAKNNTDKHLISLSGNSIEFGRVGIGASYRSINKNAFLKFSSQDQIDTLKRLRETLEKQFININAGLLNSTLIIPQIKDGEVSAMFNGKYNDFVKQNTETNIIGVEVEEGVYTYTIQPVIRIDDSFVNKKEEVKPEVKEETTNEETKPEEQIEESSYEDLGLDINPDEINDIPDVDLLPKARTEEELSKTKSLYDRFVIPGLNLKLQNELITTIASDLYQRALRNDEGKKPAEVYKTWEERINTSKQKAENNIKLAVEKGDKNAETNFRKISNLLNNISSNYGLVKKLTTQYTKLLNGVTIEQEFEEDGDIQEFIRNSFEDSFTLTLDSKKSLSKDIRKFLAFTESRNSDFTVKKNFLGYPAFENFDTVYNTLHTVLVDVAPNIGAMQFKMEDHLNNSKVYWLQSVIENLDEAPTTVVNKFVVDMRKHYVRMSKIVWSKIPIFNKDKKLSEVNYALTLYDDNSNSIQQTVLTDWYDRLKNSLIVSPKAGEYYYNDNAQKVVNTAEAWSDKLPTKEELDGWFKDIGLNIDSIILDRIYEGKFYYNRKPYTLDESINDKGGLINSIVESIKSSIRNNIPIEDNKGFTRETVVTFLANLQGKVSNQVLSNSHRSGDRIIYSYSMNKWFIDRFNNLNQNIDNLQEKLSNVAFAKNSMWLKWKKDNIDKLSESTYFYAPLEPLKQMDKSSKKNRELTKLSNEEHELYKLGLFQSNAVLVKIEGNEYRKAAFLYPTMSDKSTAVGIQTYAIVTKLDKDGIITDSIVDLIYEQVVQPEINRMAAHGKISKKINQKDYTPESIYHFYQLPLLNEIEGLVDRIKAEDYILKDYQDAIKKTIKNYVAQLRDEKLDLWQEAGIGVTSKLKSLDGTTYTENNKFLNQAYLQYVAKGDKLNYAATDMVVNYMLANANMNMLYTSDPANYFKKNQEETEVNIGKRLAFDIAPGLTPANADDVNNDYYQVFLKDPKRESLEIKHYINLFKDNRAEDYKKIEGADAQEFTTLKERLLVKELFGNLSDEIRLKAIAIIDREIKAGNHYYWNNIEKELTKGEVDKLKDAIINPEKPVYTNQIIDEQLEFERRVYIKSSAFPLVPNLTSGLEIDNLRIALEKFEANNPGGKTVRAVFGTGTKLGYVTNPVKVYNEDSTVLSADDIYKQIEIDKTALYLPRIGFRIQQDVPYHEEPEVNDGSQQRKLLFCDIRDVKGFKLDGFENPLTGEQLEDIYTDTYKQLYELKYKELLSELTKDGKLDVEKLADILEEESVSRNYSFNDIAGLELVDGKFAVPLWLSASSYKYQSMLNSIVSNRIVRLKLPGNSFVLGTEEGFKSKTKVVEIQDAVNIITDPNSGIVYTPSWNGELRPSTVEAGVFYPDQVLIPWKFKAKLEKYIDPKTGLLNLDKVNPKLLNMFGFRIPTQLHSSMAMIEVVGFLPEEMGDLVIAPRDFTKRMGSDFDIDKLYSYQYATKEINDGAGSRLIVDYEGVNGLTNKLLDIHFAVMSNTSDVVQAKIKSALGFGDLHNVAETISEITTKASEFNTILSDEYQRRKFLSATSGKVLVGITSNLSVLNASAQRHNLYFDLEEGQDHIVKLGSMVADGNLFTGRTFKGNLISHVIAAFQSAAVDNEKEQILARINLSSDTSDAMIAMAAMGFDEDVISAFLSQPVIVDYIKALKKYTSSLSVFTPGAKQKAEADTIAKYGDVDTTEALRFSEMENLSPEDVYKKLLTTLDPTTPDFNKYQTGFLKQFLVLSEKGRVIGNLQTTVNTDSSGIPKNLFESSSKEAAIRNLDNNPIRNAEKLIGEYVREDISGFNTLVEIKPKTINGFATVYGLFTANKLWEPFFEPYFSEGFRILVEENLAVSPNNDLSTSQLSQIKKDLFEDVKSFVFSKQDSGLYDDNIITERARLFIDSDTNKSLSTIIKSIEENPYIRTNNFFNKFTLTSNTNGLPSLVKFNAATGENFDESNIYLGALEALTGKNQPVLGTFNGIEYTPKLLAQDLITYAYLSGGKQGAIEFTRYIPITYLQDSGFISSMEEVNWGDYAQFAKFTKQWAQSNPQDLIQLTSEDIIKSEVRPDVFKLKENIEKEFKVGGGLPQFVSIYNSEIPKGGNRYSVYEHKVIRNEAGIQTDVYQQIDTLGSFGFDEYNFNGEAVTVIAPQKSFVPNIVSENKPEGIQTIKNTVKPTPSEEVGLSNSFGRDSIISKLEDISLKSDNPYYKLLAGELTKVVTTLPKKLNLKLVSDLNAKGTYDYNTNTITLNTFNNNATKADLEKVFLHEILHAFTGHQAKILEEFGASEAIKKGLLTKEQVLLLNKLDNLRLKFIKSIEASGKQQEMLEFIAKYEAKKQGKDSIDLEELDINMYYGAINTREFISMAMTEPVFQDILNTITDKDKTLFERFKEIIVSLLQALGLDIKEDSILASTIDSVLELVNIEQVNQEDIQDSIEEDLLLGDVPDSYKQLWKSQRAEFIAKHKLNLDKPISVATFEKLKQSSIKDKYHTLKLELDTMGTKYLRINMNKPSELQEVTDNLGESTGEFMRKLTKEQREKLRMLMEMEQVVLKCKGK